MVYNTLSNIKCSLIRSRTHIHSSKCKQNKNKTKSIEKESTEWIYMKYTSREIQYATNTTRVISTTTTTTKKDRSGDKDEKKV